ncbi:hypothetical protein FACS189461_2790 [Spirochaetia bacterium]|nr:hypothetical protein FACS189461_2790 [Spirochaetia bacterium]
MKNVMAIIAREIKNQKSRFVFPSETAASLWAQKTCEFAAERSLALNRFLAWDRFKETVIRQDHQAREPVSGVLRKLFAESLVKKNAETPVFRSLIPPEFAAGGAIFSGEIAKLLPSLGLLRERRASLPPDDEDRDFIFLEEEYAAFLEAHGLFEPAWEKPPLADHDHQYYIFFPAAMEDWEEYRHILAGESSIEIYDIKPETDSAPLAFYHSSRTEIRDTALEIRRLHEKENIAYEDMAVSVPDLSTMEPYILRDFGLYDIPVRRRAGKPLADYGAGKIFSLINNCVVNNFSFDSMKSLLLNTELPWRFPDLNRALVKFGAENNCVAGYYENGRPVDVWSEALKRAGREEELRNYYEELKTHLKAMSAAKDFSGIRRRYFAFRGKLWEKNPPDAALEDARGELIAAQIREAYPEADYPASVFRGFLSRNNCSDEGDAVLARCIEELSALIRLEGKYRDLIPASPFAFYLEQLRETNYVLNRSDAGVNIFPYRVAAAAPFAVHFVLNASQQNTTVLYQPLRFLRQDKRKRLGISDTDASAAFFRLYRPGSFATSSGVYVCHSKISAAETTFSGWAIPHSHFAGHTEKVFLSSGDPFTTEKEWWAGNGFAGQESIFPERLFTVQKKGFTRWHSILDGKSDKFNFIKSPMTASGAALVLLKAQIDKVQRQPAEETKKLLLKVSATDMNNFFYCPVYWLWEKVFKLEDQVLEAKLLDDASLGLLYHEILKNVFTRIRDEDTLFYPEHLENYYQWAAGCTKKAAENYPAFQGPLAVPLLVSMSRTITKKICGVLNMEADYFPLSAVSELEYPLEFQKGDLLFKGILDRVSVSPNDDPFIVDYKTGGTPTKTESTEAENSPLVNFQIPMYAKLYEEKTGIKIDGAYFISINQAELAAIVGKPGKKRGHSREDYQPTIDALDSYITAFASSINRLDFSPKEIPFENCVSCDYRSVCRTVYALNPEASHVE